jgi:translation initiation factor IF-3
VNDRIRAREVRLIDPNGEQIGVQKIEAARYLADELGLDLVEVAPDARPPVVRLMDYGKFKYDESVKAREARKKQTRVTVKEVQFRPKIGKADYDVKLKRVIRFLEDGDKVKATMRFRGREVTHAQIGLEILKGLAESVADLGDIEAMPRLDGRQMTMVIAPKKRKEREDRSEQKSEAQDAVAAETAVTADDATEEHGDDAEAEDT